MKIYHIAKSQDWETAKKHKEYTADSLSSQGFIHCSKESQVVAVANTIFKGNKNLMLLEIEEDKVKPEIKYEKPLGENEAYPHIYGALNIDAVTKVIEFEPDADSFFTFP